MSQPGGQKREGGGRSRRAGRFGTREEGAARRDRGAACGESGKHAHFWDGRRLPGCLLLPAGCSLVERVRRVLRTKTSDRGAWIGRQGGRTPPELPQEAPAHSGDFRPRPERAHFPRSARIAERSGRPAGGGGGASYGSGGGGGTAAGREAGAQNSGGGRATSAPQREVSQPLGAAAPPLVPLLCQCVNFARIVGRFKTLDFLVRRLKVTPGAAGGQKSAGVGHELPSKGAAAGELALEKEEEEEEEEEGSERALLRWGVVYVITACLVLYSSEAEWNAQEATSCIGIRSSIKVQALTGLLLLGGWHLFQNKPALCPIKRLNTTSCITNHDILGH